jgi:hypothetical protein
VLVLDTDPLMTAAWAQMLFDDVPEALLAYPKADLYLLFEPDVPWVADGTRFFGTEEKRARFAAIAEDMLVRTGVTYRRIAGDWPFREAQAVAAIEEALRRAGRSAGAIRVARGPVALRDRVIYILVNNAIPSLSHQCRSGGHRLHGPCQQRQLPGNGCRRR